MRVTEICRYATQPINKLIEELHTPQETSDLMLMGTAYHSLILRENRWVKEPTSDLVILDFLNFRTKEAQEAKAQAIKENKIPILKKNFQDMQRNIAFLLKDLDLIFRKGGVYEKEFKGDIGVFQNVIGHLDYHNDTEVIDLKITSKYGDFSKIVFDSGYQLQMFMYMTLAKKEKAKLVFVNTNALTIDIVELNKAEITQECEALLSKAESNMLKVLECENSPLVTTHKYNTPQWAFNKLMECENE